MEWYLLHPAAVHFPIALLTLGWCVGLWSRRKPDISWLPQAASGLLWLGAAAAWIALGSGLLAEETAPHVPAAWRSVNQHRTLGYWTTGIFTVLSIWRWRLIRRWEGLFLLLWLAGCGLLLATAYKGGELVFTHGMGALSRLEP